MAFIPSSNSVVTFQSDPTKLVGTVSVVGNMNSSVTAFQGSNPWIVNQPSPSIIAYQAAGSILAVSGSFSSTPQNSIIAIQAAGSVLQVRTDNASVVAVLSNSSVTALQGTNPWLVNVPTPSYISYQAAGSILAVSGNFSANPQGSIVALQLAGSIMAVSGTFTANPQSSITALQLAGSVIAVNVPTPSYISYQAAGSIMAVSGSFSATTGPSSVQLLQGSAVIGSVTALQGTNPWQVNVPTPSYISYQLAGSVMAVAATVNTGNSSVQLLGGVAVIGSVATLQGTTPWLVNMPSSSVIAYQLAGSIMAVAATVNTGNSSVQLLGGVATIGSVVGIQGTNPYVMTGSVQGTMSVLGTVPVTQATTPWVIQSIVGTYAEDSGHISGDKGLLAFGVRNDTVASLVNADLDYGAWAQDSAGRHLIKPFVSEDGTIISYSGSVVSTSVTLIAASITGKRAYITDFFIANTGSVATLLQFRDGSTSVVGNTIAPAGGGSNAPGIAIPLKTAPGQDLVFTGLTATSVLYVTVKGYQAP